MFLGGSGAGKSTLAALGEGNGVRILGDDGSLILEKGRDFFVRPLPLQAGILPALCPLGYETRLHRVFFLARAQEARAESIPPLKGVARCVKEDLIFAFSDMTPAGRLAILDRCIRLFRRVPAYVLHFAKDNRFWEVIDALDRHEKAPSAQ